jgi:hypothetical protein
MNKTSERINSNYDFMEGIIAADQALIAALKEQREALRKTVKTLLNCVDTNRDIEEIRAAHRILRDTKY